MQKLRLMLSFSFPCAEPCKGVSCSAHAFCRADKSEAFCVCEEGWTYDPANPAAGCVDVDECRVAGTCGENTLCTNTPGNYVCQCRPGYTGNPQVRCIGEFNFYLCVYFAESNSLHGHNSINAETFRDLPPPPLH